MTGRATLATRLAVGAALVALVPLLALAATFTVLAEQAMRKQLDAALLARAQNLAVLVQSSILDPLSRDNALRAWVADPQIAGAFLGPQGRDRCNRFLAAATRGRVVVGAELLDLAGRPVCASAADLASPADPSGAWFRAALDGALASERIVRGPRGLALSLAIAARGGGSPRGVLRAWYDWGAIAQMIEAPVAQARMAEDVQLQISSGDVLLYDSAGKDAMMIATGSAARGAGDAGNFLIAWARNDTAPTDPGGGFAYVCRVQRAVAFASLRQLLRAI